RALQAEGSGGGLEIGAGAGNITLDGNFMMAGESSGDGGLLDVSSDGGSISLPGAFDLTGGAPEGTGGQASFDAALDIIQTGTIQAQGRGQQSSGDQFGVTFDSHQSITLGNIDVSSGGQ